MTSSTIEALSSPSCALSPTARLLLLTIDNKSDGGPLEAYRSELAAWCGLDARTIQRLLPRLVADGWLVVEERRAPRPPVFQLGPRFRAAAGEARDDDDQDGAPVRYLRLVRNADKKPPPGTSTLSARSGISRGHKESQNAHCDTDSALVQSVAISDTSAALAGWQAARIETHGAAPPSTGRAAERAAREHLLPLVLGVLGDRGLAATPEAITELSRVAARGWMKKARHPSLLAELHSIERLLGDKGADRATLFAALLEHFEPKATKRPAAAVADASPITADERAAVRRKLLALGIVPPAFEMPRAAGGAS